MSEPFYNARVHEWLAAALDATTGQMHASRLQLNSAALWWFLTRLTPEEHAEVLGEYTKALAMAHEQQAEADGGAAGEGKGGRGRKAKR
jgi:hypothetical protein